MASHDEKVAQFISAHLEDRRQLFMRILRQARDSGALRPEIDMRATTDFLVGNLMGLMTLSRSPAPRTVLRNHVSGILRFVSTLTTQEPA